MSGQRSGHETRYFAVSQSLRADKYPVLRRPIGGWGARTWRRGVRAWVFAAFLVLTSAVICNLIFEIIELVAMGLAAMP